MTYTEEEYRALRHTIALRSTVRIAILPFVVATWGFLAGAIVAFSEFPVTTVFSLAILVAGFESVHALHVGVERIGRYLQVYYEAEPASPKWETIAMAVGPALPGGGTDPLFTAVFIATTVANLVPLIVFIPTPVEVVGLFALHAAFIVRVVRARGAAVRQRAVELESYRAIKAGGSKP